MILFGLDLNDTVYPLRMFLCPVFFVHKYALRITRKRKENSIKLINIAFILFSF